MDVKRLEAAVHVDQQSECMYRYVDSGTERFRTHCHDYFEIFLTLTGDVVHLVNGSRQKLAEGSLVFMRPDDIHDYELKSGQHFYFVNLTFTKNTVRQLFDYLSDSFPSERLLRCPMPPVAALSQKQRQRLQGRLEGLNAINWQDKKQLRLRMRILLMEIFTNYFIDCAGGEESIVPPWLEELCEQMRQPKNFAAGSARMLELCGKSREHLARCMKKYYGITTADFINQLRVNYAANLLARSRKPVLDICFESGFQNVSWFYERFKETYGITPQGFRSRLSAGVREEFPVKPAMP